MEADTDAGGGGGDSDDEDDDNILGIKENGLIIKT